jgi:hypothetical protein
MLSAQQQKQKQRNNIQGQLMITIMIDAMNEIRESR